MKNKTNHYPTAAAAAIILAAFNLNVSDGPTARYFAIACVVIGVVLMIAGFIRAALISAGDATTDEHPKETARHTDHQTPILPMTADVAERNVLQAIRRKLTEYEDMGDVGMWKSRWYGEDLGVFGYECELDAVRKNMKDVGLDTNGNYNFCIVFTDVEDKFRTDRARERHFSTYFNEKCNEIIKRSLRVGLEESLEQVLVLSDQMLEELGVRLDKKYIALKLREVELRYRMARLKEEEKLKDQEERKAQREYEQALKEAEKREAEIRKEIDERRGEVAGASSYPVRQELCARISELEAKLQEALDLKQRAMSMAQQTRSGYVYVISNVRSFGEGVYKIGMTRRLDPMDRVRELGDASVPFPFDVHYLIYTDDAPKLEAELHQRFADQKMNTDNYRKEFFRVPLEDVVTALKELEVIQQE